MKPESPASMDIKLSADALCDRFEQAWQQGERPDLAAWLPAEESLRRAVLPELVLLDMEYRARAGTAIKEGDYLVQYPELGKDARTAERLRAAGQRLAPRQAAAGSAEDAVFVKCPCAQTLKVKRQLAGGRVKCPRCGKVLQLPATLAASPAPARAEQPKAPPPELSADPTTPDGLTGADCETHAPNRGANEIDLAPLLAPPQGPGELGRLGQYRVLAVLGKGGMGMVLLAEDTQLQRQAALKIMLPQYASQADARERFLREARAAAALKHDNVVTIFQVGLERGMPFIALEYLSGLPLDRYLSGKGELSIVEAIRIGREVAEGLHAAHARGLIHRDIKPGNIWLEDRAAGSDSATAPSTHDSQLGASGSQVTHSEGIPFRVKILDFGLARPEGDNTHLTQSGAVVGTPAYMSPEQAAGEPVDARSDLWSLGVVLYRLCAGKQPFQGKSTMALLSALALETPPPVRELNPMVPAELDQLIGRLLAKNRNDRPASARQVADALRELEHQIAQAARTTSDAASGHKTDATQPARSGKSRLPWVLTLAGGLLAALAFGIILFLQTPDGVITIQSDDPGVEVVIDKDGATVKGADKETIRLTPGEHGFTVKRGDFKIDTDKLLIKKGDQITLKVDFHKGKMQLVRGNEVIKQRDFLPGGKPPDVPQQAKNAPGEAPKELPAAENADLRAAKYVLSIGGAVAVNGQESYIKTLEGLPGEPFRLTLVDLWGNQKANDAGLANFKGCKNLKTLCLQQTRITDQGLVNFKDCKGLTHLNLCETPLTNAGLEHFRDCKELEELFIHNTRVTDAGLAGFKHCTKLKMLALTYLAVTNAGLANFKGFTEFEYLDLKGTKVTDEGLAQIGQCKNLVRLDLAATQITDTGLARFKNCKLLRQIDLSATRIGDEGLAQFADCKGLADVGLSQTRITDKGLEVLKGCKNLYRLEAAETGIGDAGLAHLKQCDQLSHLFLQRTRVTDEGLAFLKNCKNLAHVNLSGTQVTDACLKQFALCKNLATIDLDGTKVTAAGVASLTRALPECKVTANPEPNRVPPPTNYLVLGQMLHSKGDLDEAEQAYRKATELNAKDALAYLGLGNVLRDKYWGRGRGPAQMEADLLEAIKAHRKTIELDPRLVTAHMSLAWSLLDHREFLESLKECETGLSLVPTNDDTHLRLCGASASMGAALTIPAAPAEKARLRNLALTWLKSYFADWSKRLDADPAASKRIAWDMLLAEGDPYFPGAERNPKDLARLPEAERKQWEALWADVRSLAKRAHDADTLVSLFNGKDLTGWTIKGSKGWSVVGGVLVGEAGAKGNGWLMSNRDYADFELSLEYRQTEGADSGVFLRANPAGKIGGNEFLEIQLCDDNLAKKADQRTGAIPNVVAPNPLPSAKLNTWHRLHIRVQGRQVEVTFDDQRIVSANLDDHKAAALANPGLAAVTGRIGLRLHPGRTEFKNIRLRELTAPQPRTVNLLAIFDLKRDAYINLKKDSWHVADDGVKSPAAGLGLAEFPYIPPDEYDFRIEFTCCAEGGAINQFLARRDCSFSCALGAGDGKYEGRVFGLQMIGGKGVLDNATRVNAPPLTLNQRHVCIVRVRNNHVDVELDGKELVRHKTNYSDLTLDSANFKKWVKMRRDQSLLAIGTGNRETIFHKAEVVEVSGEGRFARPNDAAVLQGKWKVVKAPAPALARFEGKLTAADPLDYFPLTQKSFHKVHLVTLEPDRPYWIDLEGDFDTLLRIEDAAKTLLLINDDVTPPSNLNSRLLFTPRKKDTYRLVVTSFSPQAQGAYTLSVRDAEKSGEAVIVKGKLEKGDQVLKGKVSRAYKIEFRRGQPATIELAGADLEPLLVLVDPTGSRVLAQAMNTKEPARLDFTAETNGVFHVVVANAAPGQTGEFVLTVQSYREVVQGKKVAFFNGKDLDGWQGLMQFWQVKDGVLTGSTAPSGVKFNTFLCTKKEYADFDLKFQVKLSNPGNSGVQIRSFIHDADTFACTGPQCDMGQGYWGDLYGENFGKLMKAADPRVNELVKAQDWNDYHIRVAGKRVTIKVNGRTAVDGRFPNIPDKGVIAWQLEPGEPMEVSFRNIQFTEIKADSIDPDREALELLHPYIRVGVRMEDGIFRSIGKDDPIPVRPFKVTKIAIPPWAGAGPFPPEFHSRILQPAVLGLAHLEVYNPSVHRPWRFSEDDVAHLAGAPFANILMEFSASFDMTPRTLEALKRFPQLTTLRCRIEADEDEMLGRLQELPKLKTFMFSGKAKSKITIRGFEAIASLPLKTLTIHTTPVTAEALRKFAAMPELRNLSLTANRCSDELLPEVSKLSRLQQLSLNENKGVTDAGLRHLAGMTNLRILNLVKTNVTEEGARKLSEALPKCQITLAGGIKIGPRDKSVKPPPPPDDDDSDDTSLDVDRAAVEMDQCPVCLTIGVPNSVRVVIPLRGTQKA